MAESEKPKKSRKLQKNIIMKTKKLNLNTLKVQSFVTDIEKDTVETIKGGFGDPTVENCHENTDWGCGGGGQYSDNCQEPTRAGESGCTNPGWSDWCPPEHASFYC